MRLTATLTILFCFATIDLIGQTAYFQQQVDYAIEAQYTEENRTLDATMEITYKNNSDQILDTIFFHLWVNAFDHKSTPYARQALNIGQKAFYFSDKKDRGRYKRLMAHIEQEPTAFHSYEGNPEIQYLPLNKSLYPGDSTIIELAYSLQMPGLYSRLGADVHSMQWVHWYPRLCVFDRAGWHRFSYLGIGEDYGEISNFEVQIDLPSTYVLSNTGVKIAKYQMDTMTRYQLEENDVVDFAMIISQVHNQEQEKIVKSVSGADVILRSHYHDGSSIWDTSMEYLEESFHFMEKHLGAYPYEQLTLVQSEGHECNGMEYPGLILVGCHDLHKDLEYYIIHEVAHQWFYAVLAFDQRAEPWLDEGLATYYENRYTTTKYGIDHYSEKVHKERVRSTGYGLQHYILIAQIRRDMYESISTDPMRISAINYGLGAYTRPSIGLAYLAHYLGQHTFDKIMKDFYTYWQLKHPRTIDLQKFFEQASSKNLEWLFVDWMQTDKKMDYALKQLGDTSAIISNNGTIAAPILITRKDVSGTITENWIDGFMGEKRINIHNEIEELYIDKELASIDYRPENNHKGISKKLDIRLLLGGDHPDKKELYWTPLIAYNNSDQWMLGIGVSNTSIAIKDFKFGIAPLVNTSSASIVGDGWMSYTQRFPNSKFRKLDYKLGLRSFHYDYNAVEDYYLRYLKIQPSCTVHKRYAPGSRKQASMQYRSMYILKDQPIFSDMGFENIASQARFIHELSYTYRDYQTINPRQWHIALEQQSYDRFGGGKASYLKLTADLKSSWSFSPTKTFDIRLFGSYFISNTERQSSGYSNDLTRGSISLFYQGYNDYRYDDYFLSRERQDGIFNNQVSSTYGGGFKTAVGSAYRIGQSNDFAISCNLSSDLPFNLPRFLPLRLFADFGYYTRKSTTSEPLTGQILYSAGLTFDAKLLQIHIPIFNSNVLNDSYDNVSSRISFSIHLKDINPWDIQENMNF